MSHEIWKSKFAAVREPAWHSIGEVYDHDVSPSEVFKSLELGYEPRVLPLVARADDGTEVETKLFAVLGPDNDVYGTVTNRWGYVRLEDLVPDLDLIAKTRPLSAAGALRKGAEIFFNFGGETTDIAGEEYRDYITVLHSYKPGSAWRVLWSPVRVVCANTLAVADESERQIQITHSKSMRAMVDASLVVANAVEMAAKAKARLEALTKVKLTGKKGEAAAKEVLEHTYAMYVGRKPNLFGTEDNVPEDLLKPLMAKYEASVRYADKLSALALERYEVTADTFLPELRGTGYHLFNAVVEVADHRGFKSAEGMVTAVNGTRVTEKERAYKALAAMVPSKN